MAWEHFGLGFRCVGGFVCSIALGLKAEGGVYSLGRLAKVKNPGES